MGGEIWCAQIAGLPIDYRVQLKVRFIAMLVVEDL